MESSAHTSASWLPLRQWGDGAGYLLVDKRAVVVEELLGKHTSSGRETTSPRQL